jgi:small nuclear ribonucleoprotein (snRNP)-like protein
MRTVTSVSVLAVLTLLAQSAVGADWNNLGRVARDRNVTARLESGRKLRGKIQQVEPESLLLALEVDRIQLTVSELEQPLERTQVGRFMEVTTSSGLILTGRLRKVDEHAVVMEKTKAVRVSRSVIRRVTTRSAWRGALIGAAIGAGGGAVYGAADADPESGRKSLSVSTSATEGAAMFGILGGLAGAIVGKEVTLYVSSGQRQSRGP